MIIVVIVLLAKGVPCMTLLYTVLQLTLGKSPKNSTTAVSLFRGGNIHAKDVFGRTPLDIALRSSHTTIMTLLIERYNSPVIYMYMA